VSCRSSVKALFSDRDPAADHGTERIEPRWRPYARPVNFRCRMPQEGPAPADNEATMSAAKLPPDGSFIELSTDGETVSEVRVVHAGDPVITLSLALASVPPADAPVELRWAAPPRGRYAQEGYVLSINGNRIDVRFTGEPEVLQSRLYVRGGGGEPVLLCRPGQPDAPGTVHDISERAVRAHFTDIELRPGDDMELKVQVGDEVVAFPARAFKVSSMRQQVPFRGPLSVEMVGLFTDEEEAQARVIRRYIMRHQMQSRNRIS